MIAALYVERGGVYWDLDGVDAWDIERDARLYDGPWPVVAHPPCERWGRYWNGGPSARTKRTLGDDGGCFKAALACVREFGGVIEHPEGSHAWRVFGLRLPPRDGGWTTADPWGGWTCCVEQGHYGHQARKATWLYVSGLGRRDLPDLKWGSSGQRLSPSMLAKHGYRKASRIGVMAMLSSKDPRRAATPPAFRDLLLSIARTATTQRKAA